MTSSGRRGRAAPRTAIQRPEQQHERDDDVHRRAGDGDEQAPRERRLAVAARLVGGVDLLEHRHADDPDVAARRDRLHAVLGLAPPDRPQRSARSRGSTRSPSCPRSLAAAKWPTSCSMTIATSASTTISTGTPWSTMASDHRERHDRKEAQRAARRLPPSAAPFTALGRPSASPEPAEAPSGCAGGNVPGPARFTTPPRGDGRPTLRRGGRRRRRRARRPPRRARSPRARRASRRPPRRSPTSRSGRRRRRRRRPRWRRSATPERSPRPVPPRRRGAGRGRSRGPAARSRGGASLVQSSEPNG